MSKQYENQQATECPKPREEAGVPKCPIRANGKFWGKFMLNRVPGQVPKEALDEYLNPGRANGRSKCLEGAPGYLGYLQPKPITVEVPWNQQGPKQFLQKPGDWWNFLGNSPV